MKRKNQKKKLIQVYDYFPLAGKQYMLSVDPFGRGRVVLEDKSPGILSGGCVFSGREEFEVLTKLKLELGWEKKNDAYWKKLKEGRVLHDTESEYIVITDPSQNGHKESHKSIALCENSISYLDNKPIPQTIDLTFLDPPFNQNKDYAHHDDNMPDEDYWQMMKMVCERTHQATSKGGAIYFMQREKNTEKVLTCLRETGWTLQNLIIWKKKSSAVPCTGRYGKQYQVIAYATKGERARVFNRLRISPPLPANYKYERENGMFVTDVWDDIRELTSGYFAGDEAIRIKSGERLHKQQAPIALLLRIILSSTNIGDVVFDPFAGTGTTLVVAHQLGRNSLGIELDPKNVACIKERLADIREADNVEKYYQEYICTESLPEIWGTKSSVKLPAKSKTKQLTLLAKSIGSR